LRVVDTALTSNGCKKDFGRFEVSFHKGRAAGSRRPNEDDQSQFWNGNLHWMPLTGGLMRILTSSLLNCGFGASGSRR
jgi:hypothetical protein